MNPHASRDPPLHEALNAVLVPWGGWIASNTATVLAGAAGLWLFDRILGEVEAPYRRLWLILFAFFPLFWVNGANTMDYTWAQGLILGGYLAVLRGRAVWAGALLGVAIGFRLGSIVFTLPFVLHALAARRPGLAAFSLPLIYIGGSIVSIARPLHAEWTHIPYYMLASLGLVPALVLLVWISRQGRGILHRLQAGDPVTISCTAAIAAVTALFVWCPQDRAYLMPLYPFLFVLMARGSGRRTALLFGIAALACGFTHVELKDNHAVDHVRLRPHIAEGMVSACHKQRTEQMRLRTQLDPWLRQTFSGDERGALVCGFLMGLQQLVNRRGYTRLEGSGFKSDVYAVDGGRILLLSDTVNADEHARLLRDGYRTIFVTGALRYAWAMFGYRIDPRDVEMVNVRDILDISRDDGDQTSGEDTMDDPAMVGNSVR